MLLFLSSSTSDIFNFLKGNTVFEVIGSTIVALLTGLAAFMANRHIAVYNDATRPLVAEVRKNNMTWKALAGSSIGLSIGFILGFVPLSAATGFIEIHIILLGSDIIGLIFPNKKRYNVLTPIIGILYGYGMYWGLNGIEWLLTHVTYKTFGFDLGKIGDVYVALFAIFPAIVVGYQFGWWKGLITGIITIAVYIVVTIWGQKVYLTPVAIALLAGMICMISFGIDESVRKKRERKKLEKENNTQSSGQEAGGMLNFFEQNSLVIKENKWVFALSGGLVSAAVATFGLQIPQSISFWAKGDLPSAIITEVCRFVGFIPLVVITALATGVYSPSGLTLSIVFGTVGSIIGVSICKSLGNQNYYYIGVVCGFVFGFWSQFFETIGLYQLSKWLDKNQTIRNMGDGVRTAIGKVMSLSLLVGGALSAYTMGVSVDAIIHFKGLEFVGLLAVLGMYLLNKTFKKPIPEIAVGPAMAIIIGIIFNIFVYVF